MSTNTIIVKPLCGKLTHDTETFSKMDPYVKLILLSYNINFKFNNFSILGGFLNR